MINRRDGMGQQSGETRESRRYSQPCYRTVQPRRWQTSPPATWNSSHLLRRNQSTESTGTPIASTHHLMTIGKSCAEWKSPTRTFSLLPPQKWRMALSILGLCADPSARRAQPQPSVDRDGYLATSYLGRYGNGGPRPSLFAFCSYRENHRGTISCRSWSQGGRRPGHEVPMIIGLVLTDFLPDGHWEAEWGVVSG